MAGRHDEFAEAVRIAQAAIDYSHDMEKVELARQFLLLRGRYADVVRRLYRSKEPLGGHPDRFRFKR